MSPKATRILSIILMLIPSLILIMSAWMKFSGAPAVVDGMTKGGLGSYIKLIGAIEIISVALFLIPKTRKIGFLLLNGYLGGAICTQMAGGQVPAAALFLAILWISVFLSNREMFLQTTDTSAK